MNPYRVLFPLGATSAGLGVLMWILFAEHTLPFFPKATHANFMFFGFMWSFIAGFLMTAVPKMTGTTSSQYWELFFATLMIFTQVILNVRNLTDVSIMIYCLQIIFLAIFVGRRVLIAKRLPFIGMIFFPAAVIQALVGIGYYFWTGTTYRETMLLLAGEAFVMNLIIGLGSRLIPAITRIPIQPLPQTTPTLRTLGTPFITLMILNLGYGLNLFGMSKLGLGLRMFAISFAAVKIFGLFKKPLAWTAIGVALKVAIMFLIVGQVLSISFFDFSLAARHLSYIGGFALITLMISTRVLLAHEGQDMAYEVSAPKLILLVALVIGASVLRFIGQNQVASPIVIASALVFISAILLWTEKYIRILTS